MKKNITINLCGRLFQIDEDAYELLQNYIESLRASFGKQEGGEEIADDIEERIAELFDELKANGTEAITIDHVKDIITRIGKPEELAGDEDETQNGEQEGHRYESFRTAAQGFRDNIRARTAGKRLYRNPNDKMLAGVLSGFATYTDTDATWWRLGYALLLIGSNFFLFPLLKLFHLGGFSFSINLTFILLYFVLAIAMPTPNTPKQVLEMKGKDVTPQNLADVVIDDNKPVQPRRGFIRTILSVFFKIFAGIFVAIAAICGMALLVSLLLIIISIIVVFTVPTASRLSLPFDIGYLHLPELINIHPWVVITFIVGLVLTLLIPLYAITHMLLSKAGKIQPMGIVQRIVCMVIWLAALCSMIPALIWIQQQESERYQAEIGDMHGYYGEMMPRADMKFLQRGGWKLVTAENCAHYVYSGEYYNGDPDVRYLDTYNENCEAVYTVERKEGVIPGIYRLDCLARAEGPGSSIHAIIYDGDNVPYRHYLTPIPAYGNKGGELVGLIEKQLPKVASKVQPGETVDMGLPVDIALKEEQIDLKKHVIKDPVVKAGFGWSIVTIDSIIVTAEGTLGGCKTIAYGVTSDEYWTRRACRAKWFSASDFKLTRIGDLPRGAE